MDHECNGNGSLVLATLNSAIMGHIQPINCVFYRQPQISAVFQQYHFLDTQGMYISVQDFIQSVIPDNHHNWKVVDYIHGSELCNDRLLMSCDIVMLTESSNQGLAYKELKMSTQLINYKSIPALTGDGASVSILENLVAKLDQADATICFKGYLAAVTAIFGLFKNGGELIIGDDVFGCYESFISQVTKGIVIKRVNMGSIEKVKDTITTRTRVVWVESPTRLQLTVPCINAISEVAHKNKALLLVENSLLSPVLARPLEHGADMVLHSDCKFSTRGNDAFAFISIKGSTLRGKLKPNPGVPGSRLACETMLEEVKTLPLRVYKQQENAQQIACFLSSHFLVRRVNYLGLPSHTGRDMHYSQADGGGSVLSFITMSLELSRHVLKTATLFAKSGCFGGIKSMMLMPCDMPEMSMHPEVIFARDMGRGLICISVGIENNADLIQDLDHALTSGPI